VGIDISSEMLQIARERAQCAGVEDIVEFKVGAADNIEYDDSWFDASVCIQSLMHVPDTRRTIMELARVTRPGGLVVMDHENRHPYWRLTWGSKRSLVGLVIRRMFFFGLGRPFRKTIERVLGREIPKPVMMGVSKAAFKEMILKSGLEPLEMLDFGPRWCPAYFLAVCRKSG